MKPNEFRKLEAAKGAKDVLPATHAVTRPGPALVDPYWNSRVGSRGTNPSPFTLALRAAAKVETASADPSTGRTQDFLDLIAEASKRNCAYCGGDDPECIWCWRTEPTLVHKAGEILVDKHHIWVDEGAGKIRKHYIGRDPEGRTLLLLDGREIEI